MQITAGKFKGRALKSPKGLLTRPTTSKVRQALFNILGSKVVDAKILDLFAGSGIISFEALSRGAKSSLAVDTSGPSLSAIKSNAAILGVESEMQIKKMDVCKFLEKGLGTFDIIYADPPYDKGWGEEIAKIVFKSALLSKDGILIIEEGNALEATTFPYHQIRTYGRSTLNLLRMTL